MSIFIMLKNNSILFLIFIMNNKITLRGLKKKKENMEPVLFVQDIILITSGVNHVIPNC